MEAEMAHSDAEENHIFQSDKTSGVLIFVLDSSDPVKFRFTETIRLQVIFDHITLNSDICDNHEEIHENNSYIEKHVLRRKESSVSDFKDFAQVKIRTENGSPPPLVLGSDSDSGHEDAIDSSNVKSSQFVGQPNQADHDDENCTYLDSDLIVADIEKNDAKSSYDLNIKGRRKRGSSPTCKGESEAKDIETKGLDDGINVLVEEYPIKRRLRSSQRLKTESFESKELKTIKKERKQGGFENSYANTLSRKQESNEGLRAEIDIKERRNTKSSVVKRLEKKELDREKQKQGLVSKQQVTTQSQSVKRSEGNDQESWKMRIEFKTGFQGDIENHSLQDENHATLPLVAEASPAVKEEDGRRDKRVGQRPRLRKKRNRPRKLLLEKNVRCSYCGVTFETKYDFFNHRRVTGAGYTCDICGKKEPFEGFLIVHRQSHKPEKGHMREEEDENLRKASRRRFKMKCDICGTVVSSLDSLKIHTMLHTGEYPYRCCVCDDQHFYSLSSLRYHLKTHLSATCVNCKPCNMSFATRAELARHQLTHEIKCGLCGEVFPNKTSRNCHFSEVHHDEILKCAVCFNLFATEAELQKHMLYHSKGKREQCPECGVVVVKLKDHMTLHTRKEGEKMYACDQCSMRYQTKSALDKHLLKHTGEKPYACNKCAKRFRDHGLLRKHLLTHHTLERRFVCDVCGKSCKLRSNLAIHMKQHTNNRQYSCNFCSQAFNYKNSLKLHIKAKHSNQTESLLKCLHCTQTFQDNVLLTSHILAEHSGTKVQENSSTCLPPPTSCQQETSILPVESLPLPFISDHVQAYPNNMPGSMEPNFHGALDMSNAIDMPSIEAGTNLFNNNRTTSPLINANLVSTNLESLARGELLNYINRDRNTPMGHATSVLSVPPPPLHLLPLPSMDLQHSNSVHCLPHTELLHPNANNGHMESTLPMSTKDLQDSSPLDEQVQHPVYHNL